MPIIRTAAKLSLGTTAASAGGFYFLTRDTHFVPYSPTTDLSLHRTLKLYNPHNNTPIFADHAVQQVSLSHLPTTNSETLIRKFCSGVWAGNGYMCQRKILEMKYRHLEGREGMLWGRKELENADYGAGSIITDHFEVVERGNDKVIIRCGDSPLVRGNRSSDGLFLLEVTKDEKFANFHMKSIFFDSTAQGDKAEKVPGWLYFAHKVYVRILMRSGIEAVKERR
ncbi:hypothetical protein C7212DRAFT_172490 [Tuber magnatum]|uniref:Uncharacterized protein n=1 Tax=Tuber magnatum TaxID=42249 RepID=A0A317T131_9PEZI|nr:hypothetical protein C7212DRAFT_172490 [Tuber magnatum]